MKLWRRLSWESRILVAAIVGLLVMVLIAHWLGR